MLLTHELWHFPSKCITVITQYCNPPLQYWVITMIMLSWQAKIFKLCRAQQVKKYTTTHDHSGFVKVTKNTVIYWNGHQDGFHVQFSLFPLQAGDTDSLGSRASSIAASLRGSFRRWSRKGSKRASQKSGDFYTNNNAQQQMYMTPL